MSENTQATTVQQDNSAQITSSEFNEQQSKVNTILASGRYMILTPEGAGMAVGLTPLEMQKALEIFKLSIFPTVIQACVNDSIKKILEHYNTEKPAEATETEEKRG